VKRRWNMKRTMAEAVSPRAKALVVVLAAILAVWPGLLRPCEADTFFHLLDRANAANFHPEAIRPVPVKGVITGLADRNVAFRHWLLSIVLNPREESDLRVEALKSLVNMQNGAAWVAAARELLSYADAVSSAPREAEIDYPVFARSIRRDVLITYLGVLAPEEEVLDILKRAAPGDWHEQLAGAAERGRTEQIRTRAKRLLDIANGAATAGPAALPPVGETPDVKPRGVVDPSEQLCWRAQRAGFDVALVGTPPWGWSGYAALADRSVAARHWLLSIAENHREELDLREEALRSLVSMKNGTAWVPAMRDLLSYAEAVSSAPREAEIDFPVVARSIRRNVLLSYLGVVAPEEEVLEILKRAAPRDWHEQLAGAAERGPTEQIRARAKRLLEVAGAAVPAAAPAGAVEAQ
jgi:hypothetical protein